MRELFGYRVASLEMTRKRLVETDLFADPGELCEYYKANFGPTIAVYANVAAEPERTAALDRDFAEFAERWNRGARSCHPPAFLPLSIAARASSSERAPHSTRYEVNKHFPNSLRERPLGSMARSLICGFLQHQMMIGSAARGLQLDACQRLHLQPVGKGSSQQHLLLHIPPGHGTRDDPRHLCLRLPRRSSGDAQALSRPVRSIPSDRGRLLLPP